MAQNTPTIDGRGPITDAERRITTRGQQIEEHPLPIVYLYSRKAWREIIDWAVTDSEEGTRYTKTDLADYTGVSRSDISELTELHNRKDLVDFGVLTRVSPPNAANPLYEVRDTPVLQALSETNQILFEYVEEANEGSASSHTSDPLPLTELMNTRLKRRLMDHFLSYGDEEYRSKGAIAEEIGSNRSSVTEYFDVFLKYGLLEVDDSGQWPTFRPDVEAPTYTAIFKTDRICYQYVTEGRREYSADEE